MPGQDPNLELLRLLLREKRLDLATLQALRSEPQLDAVLVQRGLLSTQELASYRAALGRGAAAGLGQIGEYRLVERLGQGGMGAVYVGEHVSTGARRAIKVASRRDREGQERFRREGQAQARVDAHPNVLRVYGAGLSDGTHYLVMDLAPGGDLSQRLVAGALPPEDAAELVAQLADGLEHVHAHGILHRDLKPANVLFGPTGRPMLVDFGLARLMDAETLTRTQALLGTPACMAPEQVRGAHHQVDARTDVYGLGVILYECLTQRHLFEAAGMQVLALVLSATPTPPRALRREVPAWLEAVCLKALAKDKEQRYASAAELAVALRAGDQGQRHGARSPLRWLLPLGALLLVGALGGAFLLQRAAGSGDADETARLLGEVHSGLHGSGPFAEDGPRIAALRARLQAQGEAPQLAEATYQLLVWEGLSALAAGELAEARGSARSLASWEARRARLDPGFAPSPWSVLLRAQLAVEREPAAALRALEEAPAADRPELARWADEGRLRCCLGALEANDFPRALQLLQSVQARGSLPELEAEAFARCRRELDLVLRRMGALEDPSGKDLGLGYRVADLLTFVHALRPEGPLEPEDFAAFLGFATEPMRRVFSLGPLLAGFVPEDYGVQARVANHWLVLDGLSRVDRVQVARLYEAPLRRAARLAPDPGTRAELGSKLCALLRVSLQPERCLTACDEVLAGKGLTDLARARVLASRGEVLRQLGRLRPALRDLDASLALADLPLTRAWRAWTLRCRGKGHEDAARAAALAAVQAIDIRAVSINKDERHAYGIAVLILWRLVVESQRTPKDYGPALEAADDMLETWRDARYAGWFLRRAFLRTRQQPAQVPGALADLDEALRLLPRNPQLADLAEEVRAVRAAVQAQGARTRQRFWKLCAELERRRPDDTLLP